MIYPLHYLDSRVYSNVCIVFDSVARKHVILNKKEFNLACKYGFCIHNSMLRFTLSEGYLLVNLRGKVGFSTTPLSYPEDLRNYVDVPIEDILDTLIFRLFTGKSYTHAQLRRYWTGLGKSIEKESKGEFRLPPFKTLSPYLTAIPKTGVLNRKELFEYLNVTGTYQLVDNLRTGLNIQGKENKKHGFANRELVDGQYSIEGNNIIFSDGCSTSIFEALPHLTAKIVPALSNIQAALSLANEHTENLGYRVTELKYGEVQQHIDCKRYTYLHGSSFISVNYTGTSEYYSMPTVTNLDHVLHGTSCQIVQDHMEQDLPSIPRVTSIEPLILGGGASLYYLGVTRIEVTKEGFDIRILVADERKGSYTCYELPLICSGMTELSSDEGYVYRFSLQTLTLSKTVRDKLLCVGNGERVDNKGKSS